MREAIKRHREQPYLHLKRKRRGASVLFHGVESPPGRTSGRRPDHQTPPCTDQLIPIPCLPAFEVSGSDPLGSAAVRLSNEVLDVADPDAPHAPTSDLDSAKLPSPKQGPDLVLVHVQLFGCLRDRQEAQLLRFVGHRIILCVAAVCSSNV